MSFIAQIPTAKEHEKLLVFVGDEVRGIAIPKYNPVLDAQTYFTIVYGYGQGEELTFKSIDDIEVHELKADKSFEFAVNAQLGTVQSPVLLTKSSIITGFQNEEQKLEIYPTPFTTEVRLSGRLIDSKEAEIEILSISGQLIKRQIIAIKSGSFEYTWNGKSEQRAEVISGVYLLRITTGNEVFSFKVLKK